MLASVWGAAVRIYRALIDALRRLLRLNAGFRDELQPTPRPLWWLNAAAIAVTITATALAYDEGLDKAMHRVAPDSVEALAQTIGIEFSQRYHGTKGYVGRYEILETLFNGGLTGRQLYLDKLGITYPANVEMPDRMNEVIQNAATLKDLPQDASFSNRRLYAPEANDPGYVDYVSWSFDLFGIRLEALYYFYFLVLSASIALYLICFRADALPLIVLAAVMVAFLILVGSRAFDSVLLRTVHNQRFLGALCVVSYLHLLFTVLIHRKPTLSRVVVTALQAALFVFVMFTRSSAFRTILSLATIIGLHVAFRLGRPPQEPRAANAARLALSWPVLMLVGGVAGSLIYKSAILHPIYSIGVFLPYHMIWHNAYMGMGLHPDWKERGDRHKGLVIPDQGTDNMAWLAAAAEAEERYGLAEVETINTTVGGLAGIKMALHEKLIKERFLRFALHNPRFMLELYLWYKPKWLLREFAWAYGNYGWKIPGVLCTLAFFAVAAAAWRRLEIPLQFQATVATALLVTAAMSLLAPFWTYPLHHVMGEALFIWMVVMLYFATLLAGKVWSIVRPVAQLRA